MGRSQNDHPKEKINKYGFNWLFFRRFFRMLRLMLPRSQPVTIILFVFLLGLVIAEQFVIYQVGLVPSRFYKVLGGKDLHGFRQTLLVSFGLIVAIATVVATIKFVSELLHVLWRKHVTTALHQLYFTDIFYYNINVLDSGLDNPDQRIVQDVDKACVVFSEIIAKILISPFTAGYYLYKCAEKTGYIGPLCVIAFFIVSTIFNKLLMSPVARRVFLQDRREGDLRFKHMSTRVNAESVAFLRSGRVERVRTDHKLGRLIKAMLRVAYWEYPLNFVISMTDYIGSILSYIIVAIPIFSGRYDDKDAIGLSVLISENSFVTIYLIFVFTSLSALSIKVADIAGNTHRVIELVERMEAMPPSTTSDAPSGDGHTNLAVIPTSREPGLPAYSVNELTYGTPGSNNSLVKDLTLRVTSGVNLLITGDSGCGKSALFRVMDGLWSPQSGKIQRHVPYGPKSILYLPQKPLLTNGTLREQIIYPDEQRNPTVKDDTIQEYLQSVQLLEVLKRAGGLDSPLSSEWNWYDMLSPGEMQRLSFVRLFYHNPRFAMLDEATSQIGQGAEHDLYRMCGQQGITLISVGHRHSLRQHHDMELHLDGHGGWSLNSLDAKTTKF